MEQPELYRIKDGLHETGLMGKIRVIRGQLMSKNPLMFMRDDQQKCSENIKKTFHKTFQEHFHLTFSDVFVLVGVLRRHSYLPHGSRVPVIPKCGTESLVTAQN